LAKIFVAFLALFACGSALAQSDNDLNRFRPQREQSDLQRTLNDPPPASPPPTALQQLERGNIPSSQNPMPSTEGLSPTLNPPGLQYKKTYP
jgi:hypothetical protein